MRELTIGKNDAGQRLDRFVSKSLPLLPPALLQKYIRIKRIKVNGARAQRDQRVHIGRTLYQPLCSADEELLVYHHYYYGKQKLYKPHRHVIILQKRGQRPIPHHVSH